MINMESKKVYYEYVNNTVENNMCANDVAVMVKNLRNKWMNEVTAETDIKLYKTMLKSENPAYDQFATEHPRIWDHVLSRATTDAGMEMLYTMINFRKAVEMDKLEEMTAKAAVNELLLQHNSRPIDTNREKMADDRISLKINEGSFLGFNPDDIPKLKEAAAKIGNIEIKK
jgi:hypothetical protein